MCLQMTKLRASRFIALSVAVLLGGATFISDVQAQAVQPSTLGFGVSQMQQQPIDIIRQQRQAQAQQQTAIGQQGNMQNMVGGGLTRDQIYALNNPQMFMSPEQQMMMQQQMMMNPNMMMQQQQQPPPQRVTRTLGSNRMLINGIQGEDLPQKAWEPRQLNLREKLGATGQNR